jgi:hypothetical protein
LVNARSTKFLPHSVGVSLCQEKNILCGIAQLYGLQVLFETQQRNAGPPGVAGGSWALGDQQIQRRCSPVSACDIAQAWTSRLLHGASGHGPMTFAHSSPHEPCSDAVRWVLNSSGLFRVGVPTARSNGFSSRFVQIGRGSFLFPAISDLAVDQGHVRVSG